jgi:hypothetical protein
MSITDPLLEKTLAQGIPCQVHLDRAFSIGKLEPPPPPQTT